MLKGQELLAKLKELGKVSKSEAARACGYVGKKKDGTERLNYTAFYEAITEANGIAFAGGGSGGAPTAGRKLSYETTVQFNGNLLVGKAYTKVLGLEPGDAYRIRLGRSGRITLIPKDEGDQENEDSSSDEQSVAEQTAEAAPAAGPVDQGEPAAQPAVPTGPINYPVQQEPQPVGAW